MKKIALLFLPLFLFACATQPTDPDQLKIYEENNDPLEPYNRFMTDFNFSVNRYVYQPVAKAYRCIVPEIGRKGISNFASNLSEPYVFVNALLQGEPADAAQSLGRFFTNSTIGVAGIFDVATTFGIDKKNKNFGQTLYKWGWKETTPYLVWPFVGPSDVRETVGMIIGWFLDPIDYTLPQKERWQLRIARYAVNGIVTMETATDLLSGVEESSIDPYATLRTMYRQNKQKFLNEGDTDAQSESYNFDFDFDE